MRTLIAAVAVVATLSSAHAECWEPIVPSHELDQRLFIEGQTLWGEDLDCHASVVAGGNPHTLYVAKCRGVSFDEEPYDMRIGVTKHTKNTATIRFEGGWIAEYRSCETAS